MKKYTIPSLEYVSPHGRYEYECKVRFCKYVASKLEDFLDPDEDFPEGDSFTFGVVKEYPSDYAVDFFEDDYFLHPIGEVVFLFKPKTDYANMADVVNSTWSCTPAEANEEWFTAYPDFDCAEVSVSYLFEDEVEAKEWLAEWLAEYNVE